MALTRCVFKSVGRAHAAQHGAGPGLHGFDAAALTGLPRTLGKAGCCRSLHFFTLCEIEIGGPLPPTTIQGLVSLGYSFFQDHRACEAVSFRCRLVSIRVET